MKRTQLSGFTLAELLIALTILAEIATFTIPKILSAQQNNSYNAKAKEGAAMVSAAYQLYKQQNGASTTAGIYSLTPYLNYVAVDTSTTIDYPQTLGTITCGSVSYAQCLKLHNGAMLRYGDSSFTFGGSNTTNGIWFDIEPDGIANGTTNGKAVQFWLYYSGRITTYSTVDDPTCMGWGGSACVHPTPAYDPPWFSW